MITWKASCKISVCMFRFKMDATLTGRSYRAYRESYPVFDTEYADDRGVLKRDLILLKAFIYA